VIIHSVPHDPVKMKQYIEGAPATVERYGGRYLARGGEFEVLEGGWKPTRLTLLEFPSLQDAKRWHESDEYRPLKELRQEAADADFVLLQGLPD
jgi:uncharacterized protein (DUF1330 family)